MNGAGTLGGAVRYIPNKPQTDAVTLELRGDVYDLSESEDLGYDQFAIWSDEVLAAQGASDDEHTGMAEVHPVFAAYVDGLIRERLDADDPPDDLVTRMLYTEVDGERLSPHMVRTQTMFLIIAGAPTVRARRRWTSMTASCPVVWCSRSDCS